MKDRSCIYIGQPFIEKVGANTRLSAEITLSKGEKKILYFEVENTYEKYLCTEVSDAFLVGMLHFAFANGYDIVCEAPISERLLYQIQTYIIPTLTTSGNKSYKAIEVRADSFIGVIKNAGAVGTSASGGVDSYYTIVKHNIENQIEKPHQLTHLLIANQYNRYGTEEETRIRFNELKTFSKKIAQNYDLKLVTVFTNHQDFLFDGFVQQYTFRICSYILALQKLFSVYYVSSGTSFRDFSFLGHDSDDFDIFNLTMISTDNVCFYSSGGEVGRTEKLTHLIGDPYIQKHLKVCNVLDTCNCSKCWGCMRTMLTLDILGELDKFGTVFDLNEFKKRRKRYLAAVISKRIGRIKSLDILENAKKYNYHIPCQSYLRGYLVDGTIMKVKNFLKRFKILRRLYYSMRLDFFIYGKEKATIYRWGTENEIKNSKYE